MTNNTAVQTIKNLVARDIAAGVEMPSSEMQVAADLNTAGLCTAEGGSNGLSSSEMEAVSTLGIYKAARIYVAEFNLLSLS